MNNTPSAKTQPRRRRHARPEQVGISIAHVEHLNLTIEARNTQAVDTMPATDGHVFRLSRVEEAPKANGAAYHD